MLQRSYDLPFLVSLETVLRFASFDSNEEGKGILLQWGKEMFLYRRTRTFRDCFSECRKRVLYGRKIGEKEWMKITGHFRSTPTTLFLESERFPKSPAGRKSFFANCENGRGHVFQPAAYLPAKTGPYAGDFDGRSTRGLYLCFCTLWP